MKEIKIITKGRPSLVRLPKNEVKIFYATLLSCALEYYKENNKLENSVNFEKGKTKTKIERYTKII